MMKYKIIAGTQKEWKRTVTAATDIKRKKRNRSKLIFYLVGRSLYSLWIQMTCSGFRVYLLFFLSQSYPYAPFTAANLFAHSFQFRNKTLFTLFMSASHVNISFCLLCLRLHAQSNNVFVTLWLCVYQFLLFAFSPSQMFCFAYNCRMIIAFCKRPLFMIHFRIIYSPIRLLEYLAMNVKNEK